jgi:hypothetical protein
VSRWFSSIGPSGRVPRISYWGLVQGVIAEYERAKFLERSRRGKRHAAQEGRVGILCHAPYGYRYVSKHEGGGEARFEILFEEARIVQQVYMMTSKSASKIGDKLNSRTPISTAFSDCALGQLRIARRTATRSRSPTRHIYSPVLNTFVITGRTP